MVSQSPDPIEMLPLKPDLRWLPTALVLMGAFQLGIFHVSMVSWKMRVAEHLSGEKVNSYLT